MSWENGNPLRAYRLFLKYFEPLLTAVSPIGLVMAQISRFVDPGSHNKLYLIPKPRRRNVLLSSVRPFSAAAFSTRWAMGAVQPFCGRPCFC